MLIRAGLRWRNVGTESFTWGDCLALVEALPWDDPLSIAMRPDDWAWSDPGRDVLVSILDVLVQLNAKTLVPKEVGRSRLPKRIPRPWEKRKKRSENASPAMEWDDALAWLVGRAGRSK